MEKIKKRTIKGNHIVLRPITYDDTSNIIKWRNNPSVRKNFVYQKDFTPESHKHWIQTKVETGLAVQFIIVEQEIGDIGSVYLRDISYENLSAEFGIFIGEDSACGKGYGTETSRLLINYAFQDIHLHRVFLRAFADNFFAIKSYKKAGFKQEGLFRDMIRQHGKYRSMIFMSCINDNE